MAGDFILPLEMRDSIDKLKSKFGIIMEKIPAYLLMHDTCQHKYVL